MKHNNGVTNRGRWRYESYQWSLAQFPQKPLGVTRMFLGNANQDLLPIITAR